MKYYISTISDVVDEADDNGWETISYVDRTAPIAQQYGMGLEIAEFCISENMDDKFDEVLPHVKYNAAAVKDKSLHAPYTLTTW